MAEDSSGDLAVSPTQDAGEEYESLVNQQFKRSVWVAVWLLLNSASCPQLSYVLSDGGPSSGFYLCHPGGQDTQDIISFGSLGRTSPKMGCQGEGQIEISRCSPFATRAS